MSMESGQTFAPMRIRAGWYGVFCTARIAGPRKFHLGRRGKEFMLRAGAWEVNWRPPYNTPWERVIRAELSGTT